VAALVGVGLAPFADLAADAIVARRELEPKRLPHRRAALTVAFGLVAAGCGARFGVGADTAIGAALCIVLVWLAAVDLEQRIVPNEVVLPAAAAVLAARTAVEPDPAWAIAAAGAAGILLVAALAYPPGLGMGDVKLALLVGAGLGRSTPLAIVLGLAATLPVSAAILLRHGRRGRSIGIPFAPFLGLGAVAALLAWPP
jgi:leader peptidase (prepilin peptidase)/N-methyltransferase